MNRTFLGREKEIAVLKKKYDQSGFKMAVVYGRRRIGKTTLINHFIEQQTCKYISFVAVERSERELLSMFTEVVLAAIAPELLETVEFNDFERLFDFIGKAAKKERLIFFIDEYPCLAKQCPYIQSVIQKMVDYNWSSTNLFFIICGSLVGFMKDEVLGESAPLHGRSDLELKLRPFNYLETARFLQGYSCEEKAVVYGLTNGVAQYIKQFDVRKTLEENIIEEFYEVGGYFSEEQVRAVITGDRQNPALYNTIISAVATGHTKNSEIASCTGMNDITYPLKVLTKSELLEKRFGKKPYYVLNDSMIEFWFKYVSRAMSLINAGKGRQYFELYVKDKIHEFMGKVFEKMTKEYLLENAGEKGIPFFSEISDYQKSITDEDGKNRQIEVDVVGYNGKEIVLVGECKYKNTKIDKDEFDMFLEKVKYMPVRNAKLVMFSLSGFSEYVRNHSEGVSLIGIDDMYN